MKRKTWGLLIAFVMFALVMLLLGALMSPSMLP